jgi:hypothetical protein
MSIRDCRESDSFPNELSSFRVNEVLFGVIITNMANGTLIVISP